MTHLPGYQRWHGDRLHEAMFRLNVTRAENGEYWPSLEQQRALMVMMNGVERVADYATEEEALEVAHEPQVRASDFDKPPAYSVICSPKKKAMSRRQVSCHA